MQAVAAGLFGTNSAADGLVSRLAVWIADLAFAERSVGQLLLARAAAGAAPTAREVAIALRDSTVGVLAAAVLAPLVEERHRFFNPDAWETARGPIGGTRPVVADQFIATRFAERLGRVCAGMTPADCDEVAALVVAAAPVLDRLRWARGLGLLDGSAAAALACVEAE